MNKNYIRLNNYTDIFSYFVILLPIFLISGPFLSDLAISTLAIFSLFIIREKKYFNNYFFIIFMIFWTLILLSSFFSDDKVLSFKNSIFYFRFCLFSLFIWWILENNNKILKKIYLVLLFCFSALIIDSFFQYFNGVNLFNMKVIIQDRISSFFGDELKMGGYLMRFSVLNGFIFFLQKKNMKKFYQQLYL